ncbi:uncharacterized protein LOC111704954 [Eurytemora carolleeae]|uniref:uncharacterized protein LOC111704954 n=1 Tax=Eurytemora carolleeae TaxID=1294199 RepID=UPI000C773B42|nr:uncharacterized protein LOC111704954 [Eurytemora carolleeae]|eukprot:XP_023333122.1 uncharacterized protein LOC111704954 [Eurytemora affinis]
MMVYRTGNSSDPTGWGAYHDMEAFGIFTCIGYFFFTIIVMVGMIAGDSAPIFYLLFDFCGFLFFLSMGSREIDIFRNYPENPILPISAALALGSMAIITAAIFLVDVVIRIVRLVKGNKD